MWESARNIEEMKGQKEIFRKKYKMQLCDQPDLQLCTSDRGMSETRKRAMRLPEKHWRFAARSSMLTIACCRPSRHLYIYQRRMCICWFDSNTLAFLPWWFDTEGGKVWRVVATSWKYNTEGRIGGAWAWRLIHAGIVHFVTVPW